MLQNVQYSSDPQLPRSTAFRFLVSRLWALLGKPVHQKSWSYVFPVIRCLKHNKSAGEMCEKELESRLSTHSRSEPETELWLRLSSHWGISTATDPCVGFRALPPRKHPIHNLGLVPPPSHKLTPPALNLRCVILTTNSTHLDPKIVFEFIDNQQCHHLSNNARPPPVCS